MYMDNILANLNIMIMCTTPPTFKMCFPKSLPPCLLPYGDFSMAV